MSYDLIKCVGCGKLIDPQVEKVQPHECKGESPSTEGYNHNEAYLEEKENMKGGGVMKSGKEKRKERRVKREKSFSSTLFKNKERAK